MIFPATPGSEEARDLSLPGLPPSAGAALHGEHHSPGALVSGDTESYPPKKNEFLDLREF